MTDYDSPDSPDPDDSSADREIERMQDEINRLEAELISTHDKLRITDEMFNAACVDCESLTEEVRILREYEIMYKRICEDF